MTHDRSGFEKKLGLSKETCEEIKRKILFGDAGYKRPPKEHQFKKGQSGNPKGRPATQQTGSGDKRSANNLALKAAEREITIREGEETKQISVIEAIIRKQQETALKGSPYAQRDTINRYDRAERERWAQIQASIEFWTEYIDVAREEIAEAEQNGEPVPDFLPHPDDIVIDPETGVRFTGPILEEEVEKLKETLRWRDILIMQNELDWRQADISDSDDPFDKPGTAIALATFFNDLVPQRFRLSDGEIDLRMMRYERISKRRLLKDLYRGWRSLGARWRRGFVFPPLRFGEGLIEFSWDFAKRIKDGRNTSPEEIAEMLCAYGLVKTDNEADAVPD